MQECTTALLKPAPDRATITPMRLGDRRFIRHDAGDMPRGSFVNAAGRCGIVASSTLLQVYGPAHVLDGTPPDEIAQIRQRDRERMAAKARRQRLPSALRYSPALDPRLRPDWDD